MKVAQFTTYELNILGVTVVVRCENDNIPDKDLARIAENLLRNYTMYEIKGIEKQDMEFIE